MINKSFQLIRTNPRLTTNLKYVVDSNYNIFLESFNSSSILSDIKYKHYALNIDTMIEKEIPLFYDGISETFAFSPKNDNDVNNMYASYEKQFDSIYFSGANDIEDNKSYMEEFEYLAPLYVVKNALPSNFIIMRVEEPSIYIKEYEDYSLGSLTKNNFKNEIIDKWKCVTVFNLSTDTNIGLFLNNNIKENNRFSEYSFFFDIKNGNNSKWGGMDYKTGIYTTKEKNIDSKLSYENPHFNLEEYITKGYENNSIIYPYIFNFKFLFNDEPSTPDNFLKYSMNRYYGFYTNQLVLVNTLSSYEFPELVEGLRIKNNYFVNQDNNAINPFVKSKLKNNWIKLGKDIYEVIQQTSGSYKIISDKDLTDYSIYDFNDNIVNISNNIITDFGNIDEYIDSNGNKEHMYADLYLIEIDGIYHVLKNNYTKSKNQFNETIFSNNYIIYTDYNITSNTKNIEYYKGGKNNKYYKKKTFNITDKPLLYNIYRVDFSDIKDFDFERIDTEYANFDYEKYTYVDTLEEKLYTNEYRSLIKTRKVNDFNTDGQYKSVNVASEYTADGELFEITKSGSLNSIWEKNQSINKWNYIGSISHCDYPYKLNNSEEFGGVYNRTTDVNYGFANLSKKNLDYFYRIGEFYGKDDIALVNGFIEYEWEKVPSDSTVDISITNGSLNVDLSDSAEEEIVIKLEENLYQLIIDKLYYVELTIEVPFFLNVDDNCKAGIHSDTFANGYIKNISTNTINISFYGIAKSTMFYLFVSGYTSITFKNIKIYNVVDKYYFNQSTNIQTKLFNKYDNVKDNRFNLTQYINSNFDYFEYFFNNVMYYQNEGQLLEKQFTKYAVFNGGTSTLPSSALFKGIEYKLNSTKDMVLGTISNGVESIDKITTSGGLSYNGYKMSVILSENYNYYNFDYNNIDTKYDENSNIWTDLSVYNFYENVEDNSRTTLSVNLRTNEYNFFNIYWICPPPYNLLESTKKSENNSFTLTNTDFFVDDNILYDIDLELEYNFQQVSGNTMTFNFSIAGFNDIISGETITQNRYYIKTVAYSFKNLKYKGINGEFNLLKFVFNIYANAANSCFVSLRKFTIIKKSKITLDNYTKYTNPTYLYSYNSSIGGLLPQQDKNGIHIFLNDKYKNLLIIINQNIPMNIDWGTLNNVDMFGENYSLYTSKTKSNLYDLYPGNIISNNYNSDKIIAYNFITALNKLNDKGQFDNNVYYHYIDKDGNYANTQMTKFEASSYISLPNWIYKFPPFIVELNTPTDIKMKKNSYNVKAIDGPATNIKDKYVVYDNGIQLNNSYITEPLARNITLDTTNTTYYNTIKRYTGYYDILIKNIQLFNPLYYWNNNNVLNSFSGNYTFSDNVKDFGITKEIIYSKVNEKENILKLKNSTNDLSIYPMVDEIGYSQTNRNIFLSSWDKNYLIKTLNYTDYLEDYVTTPIDNTGVIILGKIINPIINGAITTSGDVYTSGIKIYGKNHSDIKINLNFNIQNNSADDQLFFYTLKYISSNRTLFIGEFEVGLVDSNVLVDINNIIDVPVELQNSLQIYEEYTDWKLVIELLDYTKTSLDYFDDFHFSVYNDIINFNLIDLTDSHGILNQHYVEEQYSFGITIQETYNKLKNINFSSVLYIETNEDTLEYEDLLTINDVITKEITIPFNNVNINTNDQAYNTLEIRNIKIEVSHSYVIGNEIHKITDDIIVSINVKRLAEEPILIWDDLHPSFLFNIGDYASSVMQFTNIGGTYDTSINGSIKLLFSLKENSTIIQQKTWTKNDLILAKNASCVTDFVSFDKFTSYSSKIYTIKVESVKITDGTRLSIQKNGFN